MVLVTNIVREFLRVSGLEIENKYQEGKAYRLPFVS